MARLTIVVLSAAMLLCGCVKGAGHRPPSGELERYIATVHGQIHAEFADRFLPTLAGTRDRSLSDPLLFTRLEIVVNRDGSVHRLGLVRPSGSDVFDQGAFESVLSAQPFREPPAAALSGDGRLYLHWSFHRNQMQCGVYNTQLFVVSEPPESVVGLDQLQQDAVVSPDTSAVWGQKHTHTLIARLLLQNGRRSSPVCGAKFGFSRCGS